jgi:glyoxylase-like metal-dependent hydrolase (beta-lactamase superfamily II)
MMWRWFFPGLLDSGVLSDELLAIRDGPVDLFVVRAATGLVCVDAGWRPAVVARGFAALGLAPQEVRAVFITHLHWDHARGLGLFPQAQVFVGAPEVSSVFGPRPDPARPWLRLGDGQTVTVAGIPVQAIATPGHTAGSTAYLIAGRLLFSGDTLRLRHGKALPFYTCFNRDTAALRRSLRKLAGLAGIEHLLSAHSGATREVAAAFAGWRDPSPATPPSGRAPP